MRARVCVCLYDGVRVCVFNVGKSVYAWVSSIDLLHAAVEPAGVTLCYRYCFYFQVGAMATGGFGDLLSHLKYVPFEGKCLYICK